MKYSQDGKQYHLGIEANDIGRYVLLPGDPKRCQSIAKYLDNYHLVADKREFTTYTGYLEGVKVSVTSTGIGGPSAAIALEELVKCGGDTFIRVGTCGGMNLLVQSGDLVIGNGAIRQDGTSKEYAPIEFPAISDFNLTQKLSIAATNLNYRYHVGIVQSKDSFYGQHDPLSKPVGYQLENKWQAWLKLGTLASEMEAATLYIVASYLKVRCSGVFLAVANQEREKEGYDNPVILDTDKAIKTAIEALRLLIKEENNND